ncbi:hypothetical protein [Colwellia sp. 20A7]|uniref:hypothetical protein n=1 Tax=Colwellia sp. 20A7 TaxID=2689569 RepID=UPI0013567D76|nr:hypothetical protein [Colwellia sp. 20A7]
MPNQDQLTTVVTAFEHWRSNRSGRQVTTPIALREQAVALLNHYSSSKITSALRISGGQLKQWRNTLEPAEKAPLFVHLPISPPPLLTQPPFTVELRFAQGNEMSLSGVIDTNIIISLIGAMKS